MRGIKTMKYSKQRVLVCRRFPPMILDLHAKDEFIHTYPRVSDDDWCGEYKSANQKEQDYYL